MQIKKKERKKEDEWRHVFGKKYPFKYCSLHIVYLKCSSDLCAGKAVHKDSHHVHQLSAVSLDKQKNNFKTLQKQNHNTNCPVTKIKTKLRVYYFRYYSTHSYILENGQHS